MGVSLPVLPTCHTISSTVVAARSAGNLYAISGEICRYSPVLHAPEVAYLYYQPSMRISKALLSICSISFISASTSLKNFIYNQSAGYFV